MRQFVSRHLRGAAIAIFAVATVFASALPASWAQTTAAEAALAIDIAESPAIKVVPVQKSEFNETILVTGSLAAREEVLVSPQVEGLLIEQILVDEGDTVKAGQILAKLADGTLKAKLAQLKAGLKRSAAAIAQARSQILQAEATKNQTDAAFVRAKKLLETRTGSQANFDEKQAAARNADASLASARDGLLVAEAQKKEIEAQVAEAELRLSYTEIRAPEAGLISRRTVKVGAVASASSEPLFRIITNGEIELEAEVPEIYLPRLSIGQSARIEIAGLAPAIGKVRLISPEVDRATRLGKVLIFIGKDQKLHVGTFARAVINTARKHGLGVPLSSVLNREGNETVLVVRDDRVERRKVVVGIRNGTKAEILDGLKHGELVVLRSGTLLHDGDAVRPVIDAEKAVSEAL